MNSSTVARCSLYLSVASCLALTLSGCDGSGSELSPQVTGTVSGLNGSGLVLSLTSGATITDLSFAGPSTFVFSVPIGVAYSVIVRTQPTGQICSVTGGSGTMTSSRVASVAVGCASQAVPAGSTNTGMASLSSDEDLRAASVNVAQPTMHARMADGSANDATVGTQSSGVELPCAAITDAGTASYDPASGAINCAPATSIRRLIASAGFSNPTGVAVDAQGNVYVADTDNDAVKRVLASTGAVETLGSGFSNPTGVAVDAQGNVYVADTGNSAVKKILASTGAVQTIGSGFSYPTDVVLDAQGRLYVVDGGAIWKIEP